jgi:hypothetical protein
MLNQSRNFLGQTTEDEPQVFMPADPPWWWLYGDVKIEEVHPTSITEGKMRIWGATIEYVILNRFKIISNDWIPEYGISEDSAMQRILYALNSDYAANIEIVRHRLVDKGFLVMPSGEIKVDDDETLVYQFSSFLQDGTSVLVFNNAGKKLVIEGEFFEETDLLIVKKQINQVKESEEITGMDPHISSCLDSKYFLASYRDL